MYLIIIIPVLFTEVLYDNGAAFGDFSVHALNSVYIFIDHTFISGIPINIPHFYQTFLYVCLYALFNVIYWAAGGTNPVGRTWIYEVFDWEKRPVLASVYIVLWLFVGVIVFQVILFLVYKLRIIIYSKCK